MCGSQKRNSGSFHYFCTDTTYLTNYSFLSQSNHENRTLISVKKNMHGYELSVNKKYACAMSSFSFPVSRSSRTPVLNYFWIIHVEKWKNSGISFEVNLGDYLPGGKKLTPN